MKRPKLSGPITEYMDSEGFAQLYPPQKDCIDAGLLDGTSLMVSAPTASGKTLIAILAMISHLSRNGGKIVYLSPLRALAAEKFAEFKKLEKIKLGKKVTVSISTGDFEGMGRKLADSDILITTNERMDSIIRHRADWIDDIGLVIADEIHLIGQENRGPTLEMTLAQLKMQDNNPQIVALSATVTNAKDIAKWLGCKLVKSDWRPVPLHEGVSDGNMVKMNDGTEFEFEASVRGTAVDLGIQSVADGGQSLVFAETRARSRNIATKAANAVPQHLKKNEVRALEKISGRILSDNEHTELIKSLADMIKKGVAFHHAGLNQNCRNVVEEAFRSGVIKMLASTPTLAAGVNLPARRVVISSVSRYDARAGRNMPISVLEYKQLCGRAGRPQFDDYGQAIMVGKNNADDLAAHYINGSPEPIESKLTDDKSLRVHVLSVIVTHPGITNNGLLEFFMQTLGGCQSRRSTVKFAISTSLRFLSSKDMIVKRGERYAATEFGQKTSMLYIDPLTASSFRNAIERVRGKKHMFGFLHLISNCEEFFPQFHMRNSDYIMASDIISANGQELLERISEYDCNRSLMALYFWISERSETYISENLGIESGDMHRMVEAADRLAYCLLEIAMHLERTDLLDEMNLLRSRINYGIQTELADLVKVRGIGRKRARSLYKHKIRGLEDLQNIPVKKLAGIDKIGQTIAENIKSNLRKVRR